MKPTEHGRQAMTADRWHLPLKWDMALGSTPTLMGFGDDEDKLVVITDGAKQMKIVAFWRDEILG